MIAVTGVPYDDMASFANQNHRFLSLYKVAFCQVYWLAKVAMTSFELWCRHVGGAMTQGVAQLEAR